LRISASQGNVTKGGSDCLCLLSPGRFQIEQCVINCVGERLPCNYLYVSSVTFMSATL